MKEKTFYTIISICVTIAIIMIIIVTVSLVHQIASTTINETRYIVKAKVIDVNTITDTVQIEDTRKEVWEFFGINNFQKGDSIIVLMDNQKTHTIYDDKILNVRLDPFNL